MSLHVSYSLTVRLEPTTQRKLERIGDEFAADVLRFETERHHNVPALFELGAVLTRLGRYEEGLAVDHRLVKLEPDQPVLHYNLACSLALLQKSDEAFAALERAIELGYDDLEHLKRDRDLQHLREDARFQQMIQKIGESVEKPANPAAETEPES